MANTDRNRASHTIAQRVAPFAPLALALLMSRAVTPATEGTLKVTDNPTEVEAVACDEVIDFHDCHSRYPTGCSKAAGYDPYLNLLKNQLIPSSRASQVVRFLGSQDFQTLETKTPSGLSKSNHSDFKDELGQLGEGQIFGVAGYLYYAKKTGAESSNCQLQSDDEDGSNVDYHIGIGFDPDIAKAIRSRQPLPDGKVLTQKSVIVEMTPHDRAAYDSQIWTIDNLNKVVGRPVKVIGQLLVDSEHDVGAQNCAAAKTEKQKQTCWRASVWELHPVIQFQVCPTDSCAETSTDWLELDIASREPKSARSP